MCASFTACFTRSLRLCGRVGLLVYDGAPEVPAEQLCSEALDPQFFMNCFVSCGQPQVPSIYVDFDLHVEYLVS